MRDWYSIGNSIGTYPSGKHFTGQKSAYKNQLSSWGMANGAIKHKHKNFETALWNQLVGQIYNSSLLKQIHYKIRQK